MAKHTLTQEELKQKLYYNPKLGIFYWVQPSGPSSEGDEAGCLMANGYIGIKINGILFQAHRLAWLYKTGEMPENNIDHINNIRNDNRFVNLRDATQSQNCMNHGVTANNSSGYKGVSFHKKSGKWQVACRVKTKHYYLGIYDTPQIASKVYEEFAKTHHGDFYHSKSS
jgi:hypothetical protein